jgi:tRNA (guanine-N7-)-methyltransferase
MDLAGLFGRSAPLEIEIGVGKGRFLREYATAHPEKNLIGIEKSRKWLVHADERLQKAGVTNARLFVTFAEQFLPRFIPDGSVAAYHVYFPDPWPKRRHHKRRLFGPWFLGEVARTLVPGGLIHLATDHADYFSVISEEVRESAELGLDFEKVERGEFVSNFQAKYEEEGRPLYFLKGTKSRSHRAPARKPNAASGRSASR